MDLFDAMDSGLGYCRHLNAAEGRGEDDGGRARQRGIDCKYEQPFLLYRPPFYSLQRDGERHIYITAWYRWDGSWMLYTMRCG